MKKRILLALVAVMALVFPVATASADEPVAPRAPRTVEITYHRNNGGIGSDQTRVFNVAVGDKINGADCAGNGTWIWKYKTDPGGTFTDRFSNTWSTVPNAYDMSQQTPAGLDRVYRGAAVVPANWPDKIDLYADWISVMDLPDLSQLTPVTTLNGADYTDSTKPLFTNWSEPLNYKASLKSEPILKALRGLWSRSERITSQGGYLKANFDPRLVLEPSFTVSFTSYWIQPDLDPSKFSYDGAGTYTISSDNIVRETAADGTQVLALPITIVPDTLCKLTDSQLSQDMSLTIAGNEARGLSAIITKDSYNLVAESDRPLIAVGGEFKLDFTFKIWALDMDVPISTGVKVPATQYAKLSPTGRVEVKTVDRDGNPLNSTCALGETNDPALYPGDGCAYDGQVWADANTQTGQYVYTVTPQAIPGYLYSEYSVDTNPAGDPKIVQANGKYTGNLLPGTTVITLVYDKAYGTASWTKTDGQKLLSGSVWTLTGPTETVEITDNGLLDIDPVAGQIKVAKLAFGNYTLVEKTAPAGYKLDPTPRTFTVSDTSLAIDLGAVVNTKIPVFGSLSWSKTDGSKLLAGSEWTLTGPDGKVTVIDNGVLDTEAAEGKIKVVGLTPGEYTLVETKAPQGYNLAKTAHKATITEASLDVNMGAIVNTKTTTTTKPTLPKTGATVAGIGVIGGLLLVVGIGFVASRKRKSE